MTIRIAVLKKAVLIGGATLALAGCTKSGDIDYSGGIFAVRSACPTAAVAANTGDITLFSPAGSTDARAIDVVANITGLRSTCNDSGADLYTEATFTVQGRRSDANGARQVIVPYYSVVVQGGTNVVAKRVSQVALDFAPGEYRASTTARATSYVNKAQATLPEEIEERIRKRRKPGDEDAAIDPLAEPDVKAALQRSSFELLIGFNLTADQLKYNVTR